MSKKDLTNFNIDEAMVHLIMNEPFYANLLMNMTRNWACKLPNGKPLLTAGVNVTETVNLWINPYFWLSLTLEEQVEILKHEVLHVVNNHFVRFRDLEPDLYTGKPKSIRDIVQDMTNASTLNKSADLAINEFLPRLPKKFNLFDDQGNAICEPAQIEDANGQLIPNPDAGKPIESGPLLVDKLKKWFPKMENLKNTEYYYGFLKEEMKKQGNQQGAGGGEGDSKGQAQSGEENGDQGTTIDDHEIWSTGNEDPEYISEKVKQAVNKALTETQEQGIGNVPGHLLSLIEALNYKPKDWKQDLKRFVAQSSEIITESSRKIRNRRYGILFPGNRFLPVLHLAVGVDSSGSVYDELLCQAFAEIAKIHASGVKVTVLECDTQINQVYEFNPKKPVKVAGRGGTLFKPVFDKCAEMDVDGLIFLTDGGNFEGAELKKPRYPVLWALYEGCSCQYSWGSRTTIKLNKKK